MKNVNICYKTIWYSLICCTIITIVIYVIIYYKKDDNDEEMQNYLHYYVHPKSIKTNVTKIIFLWTPLQGNYKEWSWGIGPEPIIEDCNEPNVDGKCLITTHVDFLRKADVVLFSIQDIKQVGHKQLYFLM